MANNPQRKQSASGGAIFMVVLLVLAVGGYFAPDFLGRQQRLVGTIALVMIFGLVFFGYLSSYAISLLPEDVTDRFEEGFTLIIQHFFFEQPDPNAQSRWEGVPTSIETFGAGVIDSHLVLVLRKGDKFSRAAGPGYVKMEPDEKIKDVIDLRDHRRRQMVSGVTRDGIPFESYIGVTFRVRRVSADEQSDENNPYPYDPSAIFQVSYYTSYGESESEIPWLDRVIPLAAAELVVELSSYNLDAVEPLDEINGRSGRLRAFDLYHVRQAVKKRLQERLDPHGIEIVEIDVGDLIFPELVRQQLIDNWRAEWQRQAYVEQAKGQAAALKEMEKARLSLLNQIVLQIEEMGLTDQVGLSDVVNVAIMEAVRDMAGEEQVELPTQIARTVAQLRSVNRMTRPNDTLIDNEHGGAA